jgi:hypothetical protein
MEKAAVGQEQSDPFASLTATMLDFKRFSAKLVCAPDALQPFKTSADSEISQAASGLHKLYEKQIALLSRTLAFIRDDSIGNSVQTADQISTLALQTVEFWEELAGTSSNTLALLFTDTRDEEGTRTTLRITAKEHAALLEQLTGLEFKYLVESKTMDTSRGAKAFLFIWFVVLRRPLNHSDNVIFPRPGSFPIPAQK